MEVSFDVSKKDAKIISEIVIRAISYLPSIDGMELEMDLTALHANGCTLRLKELLKADRFNFVHDINGIQQHIDRNTGKLTNCFLPRFSK